MKLRTAKRQVLSFDTWKTRILSFCDALLGHALTGYFLVVETPTGTFSCPDNLDESTAFEEARKVLNTCRIKGSQKLRTFLYPFLEFLSPKTYLECYVLVSSTPGLFVQAYNQFIVHSVGEFLTEIEFI